MEHKFEAIRASKNGNSESQSAKEFINVIRFGCRPGNILPIKYLNNYIEQNKNNPSLLQARYKNIYTALYWAVQTGNNEAIALLLDSAGFSVDSICNFSDNSTALMCAVIWGHVQSVQFLIERQANIFHKDKHGNTAEMLAQKNGQTLIAKILEDNREELTNATKATKKETFMITFFNTPPAALTASIKVSSESPETKEMKETKEPPVTVRLPKQVPAKKKETQVSKMSILTKTTSILIDTDSDTGDDSSNAFWHKSPFSR